MQVLSYLFAHETLPTNPFMLLPSCLFKDRNTVINFDDFSGVFRYHIILITK